MQDVMWGESIASDYSRYVTVLCYELDEIPDGHILEQRLRMLRQRHESLRTNFIRDEDGVFWQEVLNESPSEKLFKIEVSGHKLKVTFHHALLDGWSVDIIVRELLAEREPEGKPSPFRYYIKWLERRNTAADLKWWQEYLDGVPPCSELPGKMNVDLYERRELHFEISDSGLFRQVARSMKITDGRLL
jgi:hypothetical protein